MQLIFFLGLRRALGLRRRLGGARRFRWRRVRRRGLLWWGGLGRDLGRGRGRLGLLRGGRRRGGRRLRGLLGEEVADVHGCACALTLPRSVGGSVSARFELRARAELRPRWSSSRRRCQRPAQAACSAILNCARRRSSSPKSNRVLPAPPAPILNTDGSQGDPSRVGQPCGHRCGQALGQLKASICKAEPEKRCKAEPEKRCQARHRSKKSLERNLASRSNLRGGRVAHQLHTAKASCETHGGRRRRAPEGGESTRFSI